MQKNVIGESAIFNNTWIKYRNGFGDPAGQFFWLGNEILYQLMTTGNWKLRVEVQSSDTGGWYSAEYESFRLSNEAGKYALDVSGYTGDAGDAYNVVTNPLFTANGMKFSTFDNDNDVRTVDMCAARHGGGWYNNCGTSSLNRYYGTGSWGTLQILGICPTYAVSSTRMMIRRN